jgi:hypothetical protein
VVGERNFAGTGMTAAVISVDKCKNDRNSGGVCK